MKTFYQWLREDRDPSKLGNDADKGSGKEDYFSALEDEFGISNANLKDIFQNEPWVSTHFSLGGLKHKASTWQIVDMDENGATIKLRNDSKGDRTYLPGNRLYKGSPDDDLYRIDRKQLIAFLTSGWSPSLQAAQSGGAGAGGMPGGEGGMDAAGGMPPPTGGL